MAKYRKARKISPNYGLILVVGLFIGMLITVLAATSSSTNIRLFAEGPGDPTATPSATITPTPQTVFTLLAVGDLASSRNKAEATHDIVKNYPDATILTLGDNVQENGTSSEFTNYFNPVWGQEKSRIYPTVGNHEYNTRDASAYFDYFGSRAGEKGKGYYSFNLGPNWHIVVLNSNCDSVIGGCGTGSPQEKWLRNDLKTHPTKCTIAAFHHPLFTSSGPDNTNTRSLWKALYDYHTELILNGHRHNYERYAPQTPYGVINESNGIREIVVGTGGYSHTPFSSTIDSNSRVHNADTYGVLHLTLRPTNYTYRFLPIAGKTFTDLGTRDCF